MKVKVPNSWKGITVERFQEMLPFYKRAIEEKDSDRALQLWFTVIAILADCKVEDVNNAPIGEVEAAIKRLSFLGDTKFYGSNKFTIYLNGRLYKAPKDAKQFNTARYVEYKTFLQRGDLVNELHNLLATIYQPYFKSSQTHEERAREFKKASIKEVYGVVFFYTKAYKNSINRITEYGQKLSKQKMKEADQILMQTLSQILDDIGGGTVQSTR